VRAAVFVLLVLFVAKAFLRNAAAGKYAHYAEEI
jgi:hypothetical protein